jgi:hypothetical protein
MGKLRREKASDEGGVDVYLGGMHFNSAHEHHPGGIRASAE